jgi:iron complex transport system ATP-binding protein
LRARDPGMGSRSDGKIAAAGLPAEVITESNLADHFSLRARVRRDEETGSLIVYPLGIE